MSSTLLKYWQQLPGPVASVLSHLASLVAGAATAFVLFYLLYRIGLPSKPFIYVAF